MKMIFTAVPESGAAGKERFFMKKKHLVSGLAILGAGAVVTAAAVAAKKLAKENTKPEDSILLDLDGDGVADVVLEDLDGDGKIDSVTAGVQAKTKTAEETEKAKEAPAPEAPETKVSEQPQEVTTENPDLITTIPAEEPAPEANAT